MDDDQKPAPFLTDEPEEGVNYIKPNVEVKLPAKKRTECREIVKRIREYGVNQRQILYLVQLLALELENREVMLDLIDAVGINRENISVSNLVLPQHDISENID
jgi:hypothetical protein